MSKVLIKKYKKNRAWRFKITIEEYNMLWDLDRATFANLERQIMLGYIDSKVKKDEVGTNE